MFLSLFLAVYGAAGVMLAGQLLRRPNPRITSPKPSLVWFRRAIYGLATLGLLCMAYGYFIEPYWPQVTHVTIESEKLATETRPIRIVQISDLHSDPKPRLEGRLPGIVAAQHPDLIAFTGDAINSPQGLPVFKRCITAMARIAPTYAVRGNWEVDRWWNINPFAGTGVRELDGDVVKLTVAGAAFYLAGAAYDNTQGIERALHIIPPGSFSVFLYHSPDRIPEIARTDVDLCLVGDTHGGQVALPLFGAIVTGSMFGKKYEAGLYRYNQTALYVNRGIGMTGDFLPVRFCARPEVTVIDLKGPHSR